MRWLNVGVGALFDVVLNTGKKNFDTQLTNVPYMDTGYAYRMGSSGRDSTILRKNFPAMNECWLSFNYARNDEMPGDPQMHVIFFGTNYNIGLDADYGTQYRASIKKSSKFDGDGRPTDGKILYDSESQVSLARMEKREVSNLEMHVCMGVKGRVDIWDNTKLLCSYRSPSDFLDNQIVGIGFFAGYGTWPAGLEVSSIICQDTRRIGLERFKMLTVDPSTEQVMPQGSTTTFTLSGLSDSTEFSDITSVGVMLQATSRDGNITEGKFALGGANIGTIDVSDSSGRAYEITSAEMNGLTSAPWTRDDIEGKQLTFTVNGAS